MTDDLRVEAAARALYAIYHGETWDKAGGDVRDNYRRDARAALAAADAVRQRLRAASPDARSDRDRYREALERITARYAGGASAGELADIASDALAGGGET